MANKPLTSPLFILLHGIPAAGKSSFARQYAQGSGMVHVNSDRIRFELYDDMQFSASENNTVFRLSSYIAELMMDQSQPLIFDMNLPSQSMRREMSGLARRKGYNFVIVWVQANKEEAMRRAAGRDRRRPDDKYSPAMGHKLFERVAGKAGSPNPDREIVAVISGQQAFSQQKRAIDHRLEKLGYAGDRYVPKGPGRIDFSRRQITGRYGARNS